MSPKVNFSVIGAQKSGTRALRHFLMTHPQIGLSRPHVPEAHYFDNRFSTDSSEDYRGYHDLFSAESLTRMTGDITPGYLYRAGCLERIKAYNPEMKIIVLLRDPIVRALSQWAMVHARGQDPRPFWPAILQEAVHLRHPGQTRPYHYLQRGLYGRQIARLFTVFSPQQCLVLHNTALREAHEQTLSQVFDFLGVDQIEMPPQETIHSRKYDGMSPLSRKVLQLYYARDIRRLERLTGLDCSEWRK